MGGDVLNLLQLPPKAVDNLLDCLNVFHLMNLRQVCKTTKSWVELPSHLKRFFVHVKTRKFLKNLSRSPTKWSNLTISCDTSDPTNIEWIRSDDYFYTFARLGSGLRVLRFTEQRMTYTSGLDVILRNCTELETLEIGTLDLQKVTLPVAHDVLNNLLNMKSLGISYVAWDQEKDLDWFRQVLEAAKNLSYFRIPFILSSSVYNLYPSLDVDAVEDKLNEITDRCLFAPIKNILDKKKNNDNSFKLGRLQVENFDLEQLLQNKLLVHCQQSSCLLLSVIECFERPLSAEETTLLGDTVHSLLNCSKFLDISKLHKLQSISISDDCVDSSDTDKKFCLENTLPSLQSVNLTLTLTKSILQSERMAYCFLQQRRESVHTVSVTFQSELKGSAQASVFRTPNFSTSFPNLKTIRLNGFDGKSGDYHLLWQSFPNLKQLHLENCRTCNDAALIGDDKEAPLLLQLKELKRLSLEYCGDITDLSLSSVISKLHLECLSLAQPKITYTNGLSCLANPIFPLYKSLMMFNCMKPDHESDPCSEDAFRDYLSVKTFFNLKKTEILF